MSHHSFTSPLAQPRHFAAGTLRFTPALMACVALVWLSPMSVSSLSAGPKYRAFQNPPPKEMTVSDLRPVAAVSDLQGEVSDSPPVFTDGEFSTISGASISTSIWRNSQKPMATVEPATTVARQSFPFHANSLQNGLARMAVLYHSLSDIR
jgi:hypothetical protein